MTKCTYRGEKKNYCKCGCGTLVYNNYAPGHYFKMGIYKCSEETKEKISAALKGENAPFLGRKHTDEAKRKIAKARTGTKWSAETREKILKIREKKHLQV